MRTYSITGKQLVILALLTAVFASSVVIIYDRFGPALLGRLAGAKVEKSANETQPVAAITDPSVATDEKNNAEVYKAMSPGVVNITSTATSYVQDWFFAYPQERSGTGSGSIIDKEGHILTNFHVVQGAEKLDVALANGQHHKAVIIGVDEDNDLAIIKIDAPSKDLTPIPLGNSKELFVGQKVLAIGNPFGFDRTLTTGIVSGLARQMHSEFTGRLIEGVIQTDASINPGNSGGPLLDSRGRMIGINTMIYSPSGASAGIGFAVPVETANRIIPDILAYGRVRRPKLGITQLPVSAQMADQLALPVKSGLLIMQVVPGSAADKAGIKGGTQPYRVRGGIIYLGGDIITSVDGQPVRSRDDLDRILNAKNLGDRVQVEVARGERRLKFEVELAEAPDAGRRRS
jgi:putative serine protease PepD